MVKIDLKGQVKEFDQGITAAGNPTPACPVATAGEGRHAAAHNHIHNEGGRHARTSAGNADTLHQS